MVPPFPLWIPALGAMGALALAAGLFGLFGAAPETLLTEPALHMTLIVVGGVLLVAETVGLVFHIRERASRER